MPSKIPLVGWVSTTCTFFCFGFLKRLNKSYKDRAYVPHVSILSVHVYVCMCMCRYPKPLFFRILKLQSLFFIGFVSELVGCLPSKHEAQGCSPATHNLVDLVCNPSFRKRRHDDQGHPQVRVPTRATYLCNDADDERCIFYGIRA